MFVVFLLCGFWHGASWTFVTWGILHGTLLILERAFLLKGLVRLPKPLQNIYAMGLVMAGWVLFRAESFTNASTYFHALFQLKDWSRMDWSRLDPILNAEGWAALFIGVLAATRLRRILGGSLLFRESQGRWTASPAGIIVVLFLLLGSAMKLANSTFNPFIYYRF
jgi:alginate O-acetyltransferase complex protein AlgI